MEHFACQSGAVEAQRIVDDNSKNEKAKGKKQKTILEGVCIFNDTIVIDKGMLQFYSDMVKSADGELFKANLFKVIDLSKTIAEIVYAASNSITILNQAGSWFTHCDFSGIRIPDANLYKAFFSAANLLQSDLTGCILTSSFL